MGGKISIPQFDQNDRPYTKKQRKKLLKEALTNQKEHSNVAREMSESAKHGNPVEASLFNNIEALKEKEAQLRAAGVELPKVDAKMEKNEKVEKILSRLEQQKEKGTLKEKDLKKVEKFVKLNGNSEQTNKFAELKNSFVLQPNPSEKKVNKLWNKIKNIFTKKQIPETQQSEQVIAEPNLNETPKNEQAEKGVEANDSKSPEKQKEKGKLWKKIKNIFVKKAKVETPQNAQVKAEPNLNETPKNEQAEKGVEANDSKSPEKPKEKGKLWNKIKNIFTKKQKPASQNVEQAVQGATEESGKIKTFMKNAASKISNCAKGKGGKVAILAGIATAVLLLFNTSKQGNSHESGVEEHFADSISANVNDSSYEQDNVADTTGEEQSVEQDEISEGVNDDSVADESNEVADNGESPSVINNSNTETSSMVDASGHYTVKKGDCVWNIAKAYLTETLDRRPTNAEILEETRQIMRNNSLELIDNYYARINPDDILDLRA